MPSASAISWSVAPRSASLRPSSASSGRYRVGAPLRMPSATCSTAMRPRALVGSSLIRAAMSSRVLSLCPWPRALCRAHWYPAARYAAAALLPSASAFAKSSWRSVGSGGIIQALYIARTASPYHNIGYCISLKSRPPPAFAERKFRPNPARLPKPVILPATSLDQLVDAGEDRLRYGEAERFRGLEVDG